MSNKKDDDAIILDSAVYGFWDNEEDAVYDKIVLNDVPRCELCGCENYEPHCYCTLSNEEEENKMEKYETIGNSGVNEITEIISNSKEK